MPTSSGNHGKPQKKVPCIKNFGIRKNLNNHGKIMDFFKNNLVKPTAARKLAVRHSLTASFLATGGFKFELFQNTCMAYKHAYLNTLLLLHSAFISVW